MPEQKHQNSSLNVIEPTHTNGNSSTLNIIELHHTKSFDQLLATKLNDINAAIIISQLDYWIRVKKDKNYGVKIGTETYIYNSFSAWVQQQFSWLSEWKFRKSMKLLRDLKIVKVVRYREKKWDQTNYYSLDYQALKEYRNGTGQTAETIENSELCFGTDQERENQSLEIEKVSNSYKEQTLTGSNKTTNKEQVVVSSCNIENTADSQEKVLVVGREKTNGDSRKKRRIGDGSKTKLPKKIINNVWQQHLEIVKELGVLVNSTVISYLQKNKKSVVENAIAALKEKSVESVVSANSFLIQAIKNKWTPNYSVAAKNESSQKDENSDNKLFYAWLRLAKKYGYCISHESRENELWVNLTGDWKRFTEAIAIISLDYLQTMEGTA